MPIPTTDDYYNYLNGDDSARVYPESPAPIGQPEVLSGGAVTSISAPAEDAPPLPATPESFQPNTTQQSPSPISNQAALANANSGGSLFDPIESSLATGRDALGQAQQSFQAQTQGVVPTNIRGMVDQSLAGGDIEPVKNLVSQAYQGPTNLQFDWSDPNLQPYARALQDPGQLQGLIGLQNPNLTSGMAQREAYTTYRDPAFREQARGYGQQIDDFFAEAAAAQERAARQAAELQAQYQGAQQEARGYLQSDYDRLLADLDRRAVEANEQNRQLSGAYADLLAGASPESAQAAGVTPLYQAMLEGTSGRREADQAAQEILGQYEGIEDIPLANKRISGRGKDIETFDLGGQEYSLDNTQRRFGPQYAYWSPEGWQYGIPDEWKVAADELIPLNQRRMGIRDQGTISRQEAERVFGKDVVAEIEAGLPGPGFGRQSSVQNPYVLEKALYDYARQQQADRDERWKEQGRQIIERQQQMEERFGAPGVETTGTNEARQEAGDLAAYKPLYGHEAVAGQPAGQLPRLEDYFEFQPGMMANRSNVASAEDRDRLTKIEAILEFMPVLQQAEPFRAAQVMADVDGLLEAEESALEARKGALDEAGKAWLKQVKAQRKAYNKAKKNQFISDLVGGLTLGLSGGLLSGPVAGYMATQGDPVPTVPQQALTSGAY